MKKSEVFLRMGSVAPPLLFPRSPRLLEFILDSRVGIKSDKKTKWRTIQSPEKKKPVFQKNMIQEEEKDKFLLFIYFF